MRKNSRSSKEDKSYYIYYILLENNKFYVTNYKTRLVTIDDIKKTSALSGPDWLIRNRPLSIIKIIENNPIFSMEDYVINYMCIEGIQNVRGSVYRYTELSPETEIIILKKMKKLYIPINCGDYVEESDSGSGSGSDSEFSEKKRSGFFARAYRWFCFKKINNNDSKVSLID
jgi:hypothetical protein